MKNAIYTAAALLVFSVASAQTDPQKPSSQKTKVDTTTIDKTNPEEIKTSETVKTKNHDKTRKNKTTAKDTVVGKRRNP